MLLAPQDSHPRVLEGVKHHVDEVLMKYGYDQSKLIAIFQEIQGRLRYLPREVVEYVAQKLRVPLSEVVATITFYHQFRLTPIGEFVFQVCYGTACYLRGASEVYEAIRMALRGEGITLEKARCFGCCSLAPVVMVVDTRINERYIHGKLSPQEARKVVMRYLTEAQRRWDA
ncbi:MAG: NAD(P)H-dependent oxidoreductase subunit E [Ignisphaera sp.]|nr:NAD(P)H-dependent oxidoreductase subunit E [Ignisphaera sp.]MDW8085379.1 NAD(P)H-dependent oxidoreductase subunit E [Ignisphaera sp.]